MISAIPKFTPDQWEFLSMIYAFDEPVSVDVIAKLVNLTHGQFLELMRKCDSLGWIRHEDNGCLSLSNDLPPSILSKINQINTSDQFTKIVNDLKANDLVNHISPEAFKKIRQKSCGAELSLEKQISRAIEALKAGEKDFAKKQLHQIDEILSSLGEGKQKNPRFLQDIIKLSEYAILRSVGLSSTIRILKKIIPISCSLGYERNWAIANLLLGRTYWLRNELHESILYLERGKKKVEELGDRDISTYACLFIGLYYYIKGYLNKAANYLKTATQLYYSNEGDLLNYEAPILLAYCDINRSDFHRAVGQLDFSRQCAVKRKDYYTASLYRAMIGVTLWVIGKREEAIFHLEGSQSDSLAADNIVGYWIGLFGLSSLYFSEGNIEEGTPLFEKTLMIAKKAEVFHQIFHPIYLESYFNAEQAGCKLPKSWYFKDLFERIMAEPNDDLRGVAMRLMAVKLVTENKSEDVIFEHLLESEALLVKCEDSFQLSKTRIEMVRYYIRNSDYENARSLAQDIFIEIKGYREKFFPDDLEFLLEGAITDFSYGMNYENSFEPILRILEGMFSTPDDATKMELCLTTLSRFFRAERSGIFYYKNAQKQEAPELLIARNLSRSLTGDQHFSRSMDLIMASFNERKPLISENLKEKNVQIDKGCLSAMCLPLTKGNKVIAVLYFDNSYLSNCFDFIDSRMLELLSGRLSGIMEKQLFDMINPANKQKSLKKEDAKIPVPSGCCDLIANDPKITELLNKAARLAQSVAPILLLGETGVGKEIVAEWIHYSRFRKDKPFVVVDLTTISENLVESELFGHEKGAFTGAHSQKIGRVELSEGGTLFFDEIGEIPIHLQPKLLRLLEKKTFTRVGGTKTKVADFRIIAATNRDLFNELKMGNFREDLYYRLNTLELIIPPLRERKLDIIALADHFIVHYTKKYNKKVAGLTEQQKEVLKNYDWPGSVRELENVIERTVLVSDDSRLELDISNRSQSYSSESVFSDFPTLDEVQRRYIQFVLDRTGGRIGGVGGAAEILDMKRTSVNSRMKKLGMT